MFNLIKNITLTLIMLSLMSVLLAKGIGALGDANWIAYLDEHNAYADIHLLDVNHGISHNLTNTPFASENPPYWSGAYTINHTSAIYGSIEAIRTCTIHIFTLEQTCENSTQSVRDGEGALGREAWFSDFLREPAEAGENLTHLVQSPDRSKFAYVASASLYDESTVGIISPEIDLSFPFGGSVFEMRWSPDGVLLAIVARDWLEGDIEILMMNTFNGDYQQITFNEALDSNPAWSPHGDQIAFISDRDDLYGRTSLYIMNIDGSNVRRLTFDNDRVTNPAWKP